MPAGGAFASTTRIGGGTSPSPRASSTRPRPRPPERTMEPKWRRYARLTGPKLEADVRDEIDFHLQKLADKYVAAGATPEAAQVQAINEFGDITRAREAM